MSAPPFAPRFALPAPDSVDPPVESARAVVSGRQRARSVAAAGALGAVAMAATLAIASGTAVFEQDVVEVLARPASVSGDVSVQAFRDLATLPGPSPLVVAALLPAVVLLLLAILLRRLGEGAPPLHGVSPEALGAAERTMCWAVRVIAAGALVVFVAPALLQLAGVRAVSLTTGSMAPAYPAGTLLLVAEPADVGAIQVGAVIVVDGGDGSHLTHRVVGIVRGDNGRVIGYRTRGDAVAGDDRAPAPLTSVEGVVVTGAPVIGALRAWMASPLGIAIGLVLAWAFATGGSLLADDRRRALAARAAQAAT
jgi:signal peptidase I